MTGIEAVADFIKRLTDRLEENLAAFGESAPVRAVHSFRVSCRRLREPLSVCRKSLQLGSLRKLRTCVKDARSAFRDVRDLDVLVDALGRPASPILSIPDADRASIVEKLTGQRADAYLRARHALKQARGQRLPRMLKKVNNKILKADAGLHAGLVSKVEESWSQLRAKLTSAGLAVQTPREWHEVRLLLKRFRYLSELKACIEGVDDRPKLSRLKDMQDTLGSYNDHLFAASHLARLAAEDRHIRECTKWSAAVLAYSVVRAESAMKAKNSLVRQWPSFVAELQTGGCTRPEREPAPSPT